MVRRQKPDPEQGPENINAGLAHLAVGIDDLRPHPNNPRRGDVEAALEMLTSVGQYRPLVVQKDSGLILNPKGITFWQAAKRAGWQRIAAVMVDVDDETARRILVADERTAELGSYDDQTLLDVLDSLAGDLDGTGFLDHDVERLRSVLESDGLWDETATEINGQKKGTSLEGLCRIETGPHRILLDMEHYERWAARTEVTKETGADLVRERLGLPDPPPKIDKKQQAAGNMPRELVDQMIFGVAGVVALDQTIVPTGDLRSYPHNPRQGDVGAISVSMMVNGMYQPVIVSSDNVILAGNHTWKAAMDLGYQQIPVVKLDIDHTSAAARKIVLGDNRIGDLAIWDDKQLADVLFGMEHVAGTGYDIEELAEIAMRASGTGEVGKREGSVIVNVKDLGIRWRVSCDWTAYEEWYESLVRAAGYDELEIRNELLRRLGFRLRFVTDDGIEELPDEVLDSDTDELDRLLASLEDEETGDVTDGDEEF